MGHPKRKIRREFRYYKMNEEGFSLSFVLAENFTELSDWLDKNCKRGPELFIAIRKLEEASFYARKALAQNFPRPYIKAEDREDKQDEV